MRTSKFKTGALAVLLVFLSTIVQAQTLHLYGGKSHDVYLGCLNCNNYNSESIWNAYGTHGSKYNTNSIWNVYGSYGGKFGMYSP